jgi:hypothetical protein
MAPKPDGVLRTGGQVWEWQLFVMAHPELTFRDRLIAVAHATFVNKMGDGVPRVHYASNSRVASRAGIVNESADSATRAANRKLVALGLVERTPGPGQHSTSYTALLSVGLPDVGGQH